MSNPNGIVRVERDFQPVHFTTKIDSYSVLLNALDEHQKKYESSIFEVEGFKWKLIFYPQGEETCGVNGHISLNLAIDMANNSFANENWFVCVDLKFFVLNQKTKKYMTIQDANGAVKFFDKLRSEQGCAQLLSLEEFKDPSNGYLVNDCCAFGVEVLVIQPSSGSEETVTMVQEPDGYTYTWSIKSFLSLEDEQYSDKFTVGGRQWKLNLYPKGHKSAMGKYVSLYLLLADWENHLPKRKVYAKYKLRALDQSQVKTIEETASHWFDSKNGWGFRNLISLKELSNGYLKDDTLMVEVELDVISAIKVRP